MEVCLTLLESENKQTISVRMAKVGSQRGFSRRAPIVVNRESLYSVAFLSTESHIVVSAAINDIPLSHTVNGWELCGHGQRIFEDGFGFNRIYVEIEDGAIYESELIRVNSSDSSLNETVQRMIEFIYESDERNDLLFGGRMFSSDKVGLADSPYKDYAFKLQMLINITQHFEDCYPFYQASAKFQTVATEKVDRFEKLQYISPNTIRYITQHPDLLKQTKENCGIQINRGYYQPDRTLITNNEYTYDIYENQCLVAFLHILYEELIKFTEELKKRNARAIRNGEFIGYDFKSMNKQLQVLQDKCVNLYSRYKNAHSVTEIVLQNTPNPTVIFMEVPEYRMLYVCMKQWFEYGQFSMNDVEYLMPFLNVSTLYEVFVLAKAIDYIDNKGYICRKSSTDRFNYHLNRYSKYENSHCNNYFYFENEKTGDNITLYYQPVIFSGEIEPYDRRQYVFPANMDIPDIPNLLRNSSMSFEFSDSIIEYKPSIYKDRCYYSPDYIIRICRKGKLSYLIADAKFKHKDNVVRYELVSLAMKYLFSVCTDSPCETVCGMSVFCGQTEKNACTQNVLDLVPKSRTDIPKIHAVNLMGTDADRTSLEEAIGQYIN